MKHQSITLALAAVLALGVAAPLAAYAAPDSTTTKQKTGEGDTGYGDRAPSPLAKQPTGASTTASATKQKTGEGDTGYGDRAPNFGDKSGGPIKP
ncbi:MAG: hypothetical protein P4L71_06055 [Acetobacteraceae bacterium]|nr:hypothetical protein [Acetobacteraceae bacterium]